MYVCKSVYMYICIYIHMYICIYVYMYRYSKCFIQLFEVGQSLTWLTCCFETLSQRLRAELNSEKQLHTW